APASARRAEREISVVSSDYSGGLGPFRGRGASSDASWNVFASARSVNARSGDSGQQRHSARAAPLIDKMGTASNRVEYGRDSNPMPVPAAAPRRLLARRVPNEHSVSRPGAAAPTAAPIVPPTTAP